MFARTLASALLSSMLLAGPVLAQDSPAPAPAPTSAPTPAPAPAPKAAPKIAVEPAALDLGKMLDDKSVHGNLTLRNDGDADLTITGATSTCGCTIPTIGGKKMDTEKKQAETTTFVLKPGETTTVDVEFHPGGKHGKQSQKVTIKSDDPARRELVVEVLALVQPIVEVDPAILPFGDVERNQTKTAIATITGRTPDFAIPLVTTGNDAITAKVLDTIDTEVDGSKVRQVRVEFTLNSARPMTVSGTATIRTTDPRRRILSLPMSGTVLGDLALDPAKLSLGLVGPGDAVKQTIRIHSRSGAAFKILGLNERGMETSPAEWTLAEAGSDAPGAFDLLLSFKAPQKPGSWKGTLVIATDVPDQEKIEVIYSGSIRPAPVAPPSRPRPPAKPIPAGGK